MKFGIFEHIRIYFIVGILLIFVAPLMTTAPDTRKRVGEEVTVVTNAMGRPFAADVVGTANDWYDTLIRKPGIHDWVARLYVTDAQQRTSSDLWMGQSMRNGSHITNGYLLSVLALVYQAFLRTAVFLSWIPYLFPYMIGVLIHAIAYRQAKLAEYGYISPNLFAISSHLLITLLGAPLLYLLYPWPLNPLTIPFWVVVFSIPLIVAIMNHLPITGQT